MPAAPLTNIRLPIWQPDRSNTWAGCYDRSRKVANRSMTRVMAGCFGFFTFTQFGDVPAR